MILSKIKTETNQFSLSYPHSLNLILTSTRMWPVLEACPAVRRPKACPDMKPRIHHDDIVEEGHELSSSPHSFWVSSSLVTACSMQVCIFLSGSWWWMQMADLGAVNRGHSESPVTANELWVLSHPFWFLCMQTFPVTQILAFLLQFSAGSQNHWNISKQSDLTHFSENEFQSSLLYNNTLFGKYVSMVTF